jgi:hypothetical protein
VFYFNITLQTNENVMKVLELHFVELFPHILDYDHMVPENKFKVTNNILYLFLEGKS